MVHANLDAHGSVVGVQYHDGYLEGVLVDETVAYLSLRSARGDRRILALRGLIDLCMNGFRLGNIVLNIRVLSREQAKSDHSVGVTMSEKLFRDVNTLQIDICVFLLESSYGADIIALCSHVEVGEVGTSLVTRGIQGSSGS